MQTNTLSLASSFQSSGTSATLRFSGATIDMVRCPSRTADNRDRFAYAITLPDGAEFHADDMRSGAGGCTLKQAMATLLSFLSGNGESYAADMRSGHKCENFDLFPLAIAEFAYVNLEEIYSARGELEG